MPEAIGAGDNRDEALESARDVLADALLTYPERDMEGGRIYCDVSRRPVALPAQVAAKLAPWQAWRASGISKSELARRLGLGEGEARRILDPDHLTSLPRLEAALQALGKQLIVGVSAA
ncbi:MAG: type II toxin-antitoxin system HicB family antitoxin [Rhizobiales bacterium]|nr:type II toxin-antitoxin system HicB family antitoxin [Hyphomicrobiales bacterium]